MIRVTESDLTAEKMWINSHRQQSTDVSFYSYLLQNCKSNERLSLHITFFAFVSIKLDLDVNGVDLNFLTCLQKENRDEILVRHVNAIARLSQRLAFPIKKAKGDHQKARNHWRYWNGAFRMLLLRPEDTSSNNTWLNEVRNVYISRAISARITPVTLMRLFDTRREYSRNCSSQ